MYLHWHLFALCLCSFAALGFTGDADFSFSHSFWVVGGKSFAERINSTLHENAILFPNTAK